MSENDGMFDVSSYLTTAKDGSTKEFCMQQTMIRIKEPKRSLDFYCNTLGMHLLHYSHFPKWKFSVYFVACCDPSTIPTDEKEKFEFCLKTPGCIELTHNHGSEKEEGDQVYNTGNGDSKGTKDGQSVQGGFGHIGITLPDVYAACERFKKLGVKIKKSPNSGGMKGLAFIFVSRFCSPKPNKGIYPLTHHSFIRFAPQQDPDGYLIEILPKKQPFPTQEIDCNGVSLTNGGGYQDNSKS
jgi:lactoylglutathione lyase